MCMCMLEGMPHNNMIQRDSPMQFQSDKLRIQETMLRFKDIRCIVLPCTVDTALLLVGVDVTD